MGDSEFSMDIYKFVKISIKTIMKNSEIVKSFLIILKLKECVRMQLKNYIF